MIVLTLLMTACQKQPKQPLSPKELEREIIAATAYYAVEIVRADEKIDQRERRMIASKIFHGVDPVVYDQMTRDKALEKLSILPENVRLELSRFYNQISVIDGEIHPEEQFLLSDFDSKRANSSESEPAMAILALQSRREEVPDMLSRIQKGLSTHHKTEKTYISASIYPPLSGGKTRLWVDENSGAFQTLNFNKPKEVRGSYWIDRTDNAYYAFGVIDVDADGVYATYVATPDNRPKAVTPPEVY